MSEKLRAGVLVPAVLALVAIPAAARPAPVPLPGWLRSAPVDQGDPAQAPPFDLRRFAARSEMVRWHAVEDFLDGEQPKSLSDIGNITWNARFRLVYRPPSKEECSHLKNAVIIWHGSLASRVFNGGRID